MLDYNCIHIVPMLTKDIHEISLTRETFMGRRDQGEKRFSYYCADTTTAHIPRNTRPDKSHALSIFPAFAARDVDSLNRSRQQLALSRHGGRRRIDGVGRPSLRTVTCQPVAPKTGRGSGDGHPWPRDGNHVRRGILLRPCDHRVPWNAHARTPNNAFPYAK